MSLDVVGSWVDSLTVQGQDAESNAVIHGMRANRAREAGDQRATALHEALESHFWRLQVLCEDTLNQLENLPDEGAPPPTGATS